MSEKLFYTAPSQEIFEEMQKLAIEIWNTYDDTHLYATTKVNHVIMIQNKGSGFMAIFQMFDVNNQTKILNKASPELVSEIIIRTNY